ncbi:hypothetical protein INH01_06040 [Latilactobacillus sakei]|nr:hypothetical protein INH01_06040 [Latilactobacillus sakei]
MNYETKQEVFEDALRALEEFGEQGSSWEMVYDDLSACYAAALPDDTPVIPKEVGEYIRAKKRKNTSQSVYYLLRDTGALWRRKKESKILSYMHDDPDTFASAWLLGVWRVKETGEIVTLEDEK